MEDREAGQPVIIRWAREEEWAPAMQMVWRTFLKFEGRDYTEEGIKNFFEFITDDNLYEGFLKGTYQVMAALDGEKVVGIGSIRSRNHLSLLFVEEEYHRRGVGRAIMNALFSYLKEEAGEKFISVQAAPYAVNFYKKLGFHVVRPEQEISGIRVTAMEKIF